MDLVAFGCLAEAYYRVQDRQQKILASTIFGNVRVAHHGDSKDVKSWTKQWKSASTKKAEIEKSNRMLLQAFKPLRG